MLKHDILLFFRNIKKYKSAFFINNIGLSTGMACVILIFLWVTDELSVDKFHKNGGEKEAIVKFQELYEAFNPGFSFEYHFLEQAYEAQYVS